MFHGKKIAGILHHSLAFLLLVCVGPHCVVLFFPANRVRRGAWNKNHNSFWDLFLVQHLTALLFTKFLPHCVGWSIQDCRVGKKCSSWEQELLSALSSVPARVVACRRRRAGIQVEESRDPGWGEQKVLCHYTYVPWRSFVYTKENHLSWVKVLAQLKSALKSWDMLQSLVTLGLKCFFIKGNLTPSFTSPCSRTGLLTVVIPLLLESQDEIPRELFFLKAHVLHVPGKWEPAEQFCSFLKHVH